MIRALVDRVDVSAEGSGRCGKGRKRKLSARTSTGEAVDEKEICGIFGVVCGFVERGPSWPRRGKLPCKFGAKQPADSEAAGRVTEQGSRAA